MKASTPSSILRSLTGSLVRLSASSAVAPLPATASFGHRHHHSLQSQPVSSSGLLQALDDSSASQQITLHSLSNVTHQQCSDTRIIEEYLDFNVKMLDTCNELTEKIDTIQTYVESLKVVRHLLGAGRNIEPHPTTLAQARDLLDSCQAMETNNRCNQSAFKRFFNQKLSNDQDGQSSSDSKLGEILNESRAVTSMVCEMLRTALSFKPKRGSLSFKPKRGLPLLSLSRSVSSWSCSLQQLQNQIKEQKKSGSPMMIELHQTVKAAHKLQIEIKGRKKSNKSELRSDVEELKRRCEELEEGIKPFEGRVKELYKHLISVRMALLGKLSQF